MLSHTQQEDECHHHDTRKKNTKKENSYTYHEKLLFHYTISHKNSLSLSLTCYLTTGTTICMDSFTIILIIESFFFFDRTLKANVYLETLQTAE